MLLRNFLNDFEVVPFAPTIPGISFAFHSTDAVVHYTIAIIVAAAAAVYRRVVPKVMSNFSLHANWEQQAKESAVVDGTSCCVIRECLATSIACIT